MNKVSITAICAAIVFIIMVIEGFIVYDKGYKNGSNKIVAANTKVITQQAIVSDKISESINAVRIKTITETRYVDKPFYIYVPQDCKPTMESITQYYNNVNKGN